jgi:LAO/AO transport system kinase
MDIETLRQGICDGDRLAIARGLTCIEFEDDRGQDLVQSLLSRTGRSHVVGLTGAPGVGKSTLVNQLTLTLRKRGLSVGILAVDPSSPFSGGALLGDRIRMMASTMDPGVFMRSLANRGHLGGLSRTTRDAITLLDAAGFDVILVETVGTGQSEVEVMKLAHTTTIVMAPGLGDDIQANKAGILEIGQVFVVNKADRDGADATMHSIQMMLMMKYDPNAWEIPVVKTMAHNGQGLDDLVDALFDHNRYLKDTGRYAEAQFSQTEQVIESAVYHAAARALEQARQSGEWTELVSAAMSGDRRVPDVAKWVLNK